MGVFTNKNILQKIIIAFVCIILLNFCFAPSCQATFGGIMMTRVRDFACALADVVMSVIQLGLTGKWQDAVDAQGTAVTDSSVAYWEEDSKMEYPIIQVSPELIFANKIQVLSVDFFGDDDEDYLITSDSNILNTLRSIIASWYVTLRTISIVALLSVLIYIGIRIMISSTSQDRAKYKQRLVDWLVAFCLLFVMHYLMSGIVNIIERINDLLVSACNVESGLDLNDEYGDVVYNPYVGNSLALSDSYSNDIEEWTTDWFASYGIAVESITYDTASGQYNLTLDFNETVNEKYILSGIKDHFESTGLDTNERLAALKTYYNLTGEASTLIISCNMTETDTDIEVTGVTVPSENNTNLVTGLGNYIDTLIYYVTGETTEEGLWDTALANYLNESFTEYSTAPETATDLNLTKKTTTKGKSVYVSDDATTDGATILYFINYARLYVQASTNSDSYVATSWGYLVLYIILVFYTASFTLKYMKRVIYIAFLTLMAPLVALTYPLDKMKDGQAQGFNMWFKEYTFNILIQPLHLLIYTILVGSSMTLVSHNVIYGIVAIGFVMPAEKLMRKFFGFENATTLSAAGSFAGGAVFSSILNTLKRPGSRGRGPEDKEKDDNKIRQANAGGGGVNEDATLTGKGSISTAPIASEEKGDTEQEKKKSNEDNNNNEAETAEQQAKKIMQEAAKKAQEAQNANGAMPAPGWKDEVQMTAFDRMRNRKAEGKSAIPIKDMAGSVLGRYRYNIRKEEKRILKGTLKSAGRFTRRLAVGIVPAGALGTIGLAMGAASGDLSKAAQYAALGAGTGYSFANYYGDKAAKLGGEITKGGAQSASDAFWGDETKKRSQYKFDKEWKKNADNIDALVKVYGTRKQAFTAINDGSVQALLNSNITDPKMVGKALKVRDKYLGKGWSEDEALNRAVAIAKWHRDSGKAIYEKNSYARQVFRSQTLNEIMKNNPTLSQEAALSRVDEILEEMESFEG